MKSAIEKNSLLSSFELIQKAVTSNGFVASLDTKDNYNRIWTRDAMITSIAILCHQQQGFYPTVKKSIETILSNVHIEGWVPSNISFDHGNQHPEVSYGGPVGRIDNPFWVLIGGIFYMEITCDRSLEDELLELAEQQLKLSTAWEFNGKHLMYCPLSSNWADEYPMEGYVLFNQILRYWAFHKAGAFFEHSLLRDKSIKILKAINVHFFGEGINQQQLFTASQEKTFANLWGVDRILSAFNPGGYTTRIDAFAYVLAVGLGIVTSETEERLIHLLKKAAEKHIGLPSFFPIISENQKEYQSLLSNHAYEFKNKPGHFHNGGIWPMVNGWAISCLSLANIKTPFLEKLKTNFSMLMFEKGLLETFNEYYDMYSNEPSGAKNICFSAAGVLLSQAPENRLELLFGRTKKEHPNPQYIDDLANQITQRIKPCEKYPCLIFISGESGSGKSTLARGISRNFNASGLRTYVMSQDNYCRLPPNKNHAKRVNDFSWIGPCEINFKLMRKHINALIDNKKSYIQVPTIIRAYDRFDTIDITIEDLDVIIVEGTYVFKLASPTDEKIFLSRNYHQTNKQRKERNRDWFDDDISPKILEIEHRIIKKYASQANWIIDAEDTIISTT